VTDLSDDNSTTEDDPTVTPLSSVPPVAVDDNATGVVGQPVTLNTLGNDTDANGDLDPTTVTLTDPLATDSDGDGDADTLVVPGEGTWTVDNTTGDITFTPEAGFTSDPTPVTYTVDDLAGQTSNVATESVNYNQTPEIALVKVGTVNDGGDGLQAGDTISYEFNVTNTGNVALSNITVDDARINVAGLVVADLAVGASDIVTATYTITAQDIIDGNVTNQATVNATDPDGTPVTDLSDDNSTTEDDPTVT
ncbi:hypothetical protein C9926_03250, partial [Sulfurovum lithotrophicum]